MFKNKLKFNRRIASLYIVVIGLFGVGTILFSAASTDVGSIKLTSYSYLNGQLTPIGNVEVKVESVGGAQRCSSNQGTTNAAGDHSVTLTGCAVSNDGSAKMYRLTSATRPGYQFRSLHSNHEGRPIGANNSFKVVKGDTTSLQVWMDDLTPPPPPPPAPAPTTPTPTPQPSPSPPPQSDPTKSGKVRIVSKRNDTGANIGDVTVRIKATGTDPGFRCHPSSAGTTGPPGGASHGEFTLNDCRVSDSTGKKQYVVESASRENWEMTSVRVGQPDAAPIAENKFDVTHDQTTTLYVYMRSTVGATAPPPAPTPTAPTTPPVSASDKNGKIRMITYDYNGGDMRRQGNIEIHLRSVGNQTTDLKTNCDQYNKTTNTSGNHDTNPDYGRAHFDNCWTSSDGGKYYELSYVKIPNGYSFRSFRITSGGTFYNTTEKSAGAIAGKHFVVKKDVETQLEIWLDKAEEPVSIPSSGSGGATSSPGSPGSPAPEDTRPAAVNQVLTQTGVTYVAGGNQRPISQDLAAQLNQIPAPIRQENPNVSILELMQIAIDAGHVNPNFIIEDDDDDDDLGLGEEEFGEEEGDEPVACDDPDSDVICPAIAPSPPASIAAKQDEAGNVLLTWTDAVAPPEAGDIDYDIYRTSPSGKDLLEVDVTRSADLTTGNVSELEYLDDGTATRADDTEVGIAYGTTYVYEVVAKTGDDETQAIAVSYPAKVTFTPVAPKTNVSEDIPELPPEEEDDPEESTTLLDPNEEIVTIEVIPEDLDEDDPDITLDMPKDAHEDGMSCTVVSGDGSQDSSLQAAGTLVGDTRQVVCRDEDGGIVDDFDSDYELELEFDEDELDEDSDLYAFDGVGWEEVPLDEKPSKGLVKYASAQKVKGKQDRKIRIRIASSESLKIALIKSGGSNTLPIIVAIAIPLAIGASVGALIVSRRQIGGSSGGDGYTVSGGVKIATPHSYQPTAPTQQYPPTNNYQPTIIQPHRTIPEERNRNE